MTTINAVAHSPLTSNDVNRLPANAVTVNNYAPTQNGATDQFVKSKKMSGLTKTIIGIAAVAAALVGLKYLGRNSFLKVEANGKGIMNAIKKYTMTAADYIEKPFVWAYKSVAGLFKGKRDALPSA